jgi:hypothetical protein
VFLPKRYGGLFLDCEIDVITAGRICLSLYTGRCLRTRAFNLKLRLNDNDDVCSSPPLLITKLNCSRMDAASPESCGPAEAAADAVVESEAAAETQPSGAAAAAVRFIKI